MITALLALAFIVVLVLSHELGHFVAAKLCGMQVDEFGFGFPPRIWGKKKGDTVYSVNLFPFGGFVKIHGEETAEDNVSEEEKKKSFLFQPAYKKIIVLLAGVTMNFVIGWLALVGVFMIGMPQIVIVTGVISGSPAAKAGLRAGDEILGFTQAGNFVKYVSESTSTSVAVRVLTNAGEKTLHLTPRNGKIGVYITDGGLPKEGIFAAMSNAIKAAAGIFGLIFYTVYRIFTGLFAGHYGVVNDVVGPVGIYNMLSLTTKMGAVYVLQLLALISVNLTAINIIPFPALDGGRILFLGIGKLFRKGATYKVEAVANTIGFILLFALIVAITLKDVIHLY